MRFVNETGARADLIRTERPGDVIATAVIVRARHRIAPGGRLSLVPPEEQPEDLRRQPIDCGEYGMLMPDTVYPRNGTDVIVLGEAVCREPSRATRVGVHVGPYAVEWNVFGDRVWESTLGELTPSLPERFERMPVTWARAFGGVTEGEYGPIPWHANPVGRGFYMSREAARGQPLPNVESPAQPIKSWTDRPDPAGTGPYSPTWGLRAMAMVDVDEQAKKVSFHPERGLFDRAHPALSGKKVEPGPMRLVGWSAEGTIELAIPEVPWEVRLTFDGRETRLPMELEEILVDLRIGVVDLTYRAMFRYPVVAHQERLTRVVPRGGQEEG